MAIITSHTLNGVDGSHGGGIGVTLMRMGSDDALVISQSDEGGRLSIEVVPELIDTQAQYELVFQTQNYWRERGITSENIIAEIILRFRIPDTDGRYHMPIIISPYSYSTWKSE